MFTTGSLGRLLSPPMIYLYTHVIEGGFHYLDFTVLFIHKPKLFKNDQLDLLTYENNKLTDQLTLQFYPSYMNQNEANEIAYQQFVAFIDGQVVVMHDANMQLDVLRHILASNHLPTPYMEYLCTSILSEQLLIQPEQMANGKVCALHLIHLATQAKVETINQLLSYTHTTIGVLFPNRHRPIRLLKKAHVLAHMPNVSFQHQTVVFTGGLQSMLRSEAAKQVRLLGGTCVGTVTHSTNIVVIGNQVRNRTSKTTKQLRAEQLIAEGHPIHLLTEEEFLAQINKRVAIK